MATYIMLSTLTDHGEATRRHIDADTIEHIGKEANRWEEQLYLGLDPEAQIIYGMSDEGRQRMYGDVLRAGQQFGQRRMRSTLRFLRRSRLNVSAARRRLHRPRMLLSMQFG